MSQKVKENADAAAIDMVAAHGMDGMAEAMILLMNAAMRIERNEYLGVNPYERSEDRTTYANGFKPKSVNTRIGKMDNFLSTLTGTSNMPSS